MKRESNSLSLPGLERPRFARLGDVERAFAAEGLAFVAGIDEAGRGPLAGPVVAAAVLWPVELELPGLDDSKKLSPKMRLDLEPRIKALALGYGVAFVSAARIDAVNILNASKEAWCKALALAETRSRLDAPLVLIDGNQAAPLARAQLAIVKGDGLSYAIAAASVLAKNQRDRALDALAARYPAYGFEIHKGYPTPAHLAALAAYGPCPAHRRSYRPVATVENARMLGTRER